MSEKQVCPGCGKEFIRLASHAKFCKGKSAFEQVIEAESKTGKVGYVVDLSKNKEFAEDVKQMVTPLPSFWERLKAKLRKNRGKVAI